MRKLNLLYVITKLELGGAQKQLLELIRHLDPQKFNIFLFTAQDGLLMEEAKGIAHLKLVTSPYLKRPIAFLFDLIVFLRLYFFIKEKRIDVVHTHSSKAGILGRWAAFFAGVKIIIHTVHGWSFYFFRSPFVKTIFVFLERLSATFTTILIVVSQYDRDIGLKAKIGKKDKYRLIRYGINQLEFKRQRSLFLKEEFGFRKDDLIVGMIACLKPQKAPEDFIFMAYNLSGKNPEVKFVLVGDGILRPRIEFLIRKYNLENKVQLLGWRRDIPEILSIIDICVLTSLWEGLPISILEAMVSSKAVVVTDTGGIREVVRNGENGFLVKPHDIKDMVFKVDKLIKDPELRKRISTSARQSINEEFELSRLVETTEKLYLSEIKNMLWN